MKRTTILIPLLLGALTILLSGCGNKATAAGTGNAADRLNADYENALPVESQLILGTLMLEDTDDAVTSGQAAELLPIWQMMKELESSGTAAGQEKEGLIEQIQETMTAAQIRAIAAMQLTPSSMFGYMQQAGLAQAPQQSGTPPASGSAAGAFPGGMDGEPPAGFEGGGGMPSGGSGMPSGGGSYGGGAELTSEQIATLDARRASGGGRQGTPTALLDTLISLLETKQAS
jgi:hypothetical protein